MKLSPFAALLAATVFAAPQLRAQQPPGPQIGFSGLMYGSFNYHTDSASRASLGGKAPNQFGIDRIYLNFRLPAGDNGLVRITTDVFQNVTAPTNAFYQGWLIRLKYAYFQYSALTDALGPGSGFATRVGLVHDVAIDQTEGGWPRFIEKPAVERNVFFNSSDAGVVEMLTLPSHVGEIYGGVVNGTGYIAPERDRFKDFSLRTTIYPFAGDPQRNALLRSFGIAAWGYKGFVGSAFQSGGPGEVGPGENGAVTAAMPRDRYGAYAMVRSHPFIAGLEFADRVDAGEAGANTIASPRVETDSTGRLVDGYVVFRPVELIDASTVSNVSVVTRFDRLTPNVHPASAAYAGTAPSYDFAVLGLMYDVNQRITLSADWQTLTPRGFPAPVGANLRPSPPPQSTFFLHWQAYF